MSKFTIKHVKLAAITAAAIITVSSIASIAYFSDRDNQQNVLTVGKNEITIVEEFDPPPTITPGTVITKIPQVKSEDIEGAVDCYTRAYVAFSDTRAEGLMSYEIDTSKWVDGGDGYYYYTDVLKPGELTVPLFTNVTVNSEVTQEEIDEITDLDLIVYAESCQAKDKTTGKNYTDYESAWSYWNTEKEGIEG